MALYALSLHVLGGFSGAHALRRAALTLTPILLGGLFAGVLGLAPDVADALRIMARLRLLLGIGLISVVVCVVWATVLWTADEGRGWLHTIRFGKAPAIYAGLAVFLVLVASGGGHLYSADEWAVYAVTHSITTRGSLLVRDNDPYPLYKWAFAQWILQRMGRPATASGRCCSRLLQCLYTCWRKPSARSRMESLVNRQWQTRTSPGVAAGWARVGGCRCGCGRMAAAWRRLWYRYGLDRSNSHGFFHALVALFQDTAQCCPRGLFVPRGTLRCCEKFARPVAMAVVSRSGRGSG